MTIAGMYAHHCTRFMVGDDTRKAQGDWHFSLRSFDTLASIQAVGLSFLSLCNPSPHQAICDFPTIRVPFIDSLHTNYGLNLGHCVCLVHLHH